MPARHYVHRYAALHEPTAQGERYRSLAGAAGDQVADAHHRYRRMVGMRHGASQTSGGIPEGADDGVRAGVEEGAAEAG